MAPPISREPPLDVRKADALSRMHAKNDSSVISNIRIGYEVHLPYFGQFGHKVSTKVQKCFSR